MGQDIAIRGKGPYMMNRETAQIPAVVRSLGFVERSIFDASIERPFSDYADGELAGALAKVMEGIIKDIGLRSTDEKELSYTLFRAVNLLKSYYARLSLKDFKLAFEMSLTGELDAFLPKGRDGLADRGHYQQFNAEYICKILNAYRARRAEVLRRVNAENAKKGDGMTRADALYYENEIKKDCINAFLYFKYHNRMPELSLIGWILCYNALANVGLADEIEVTPGEQKMIYESTINSLMSSGDIGRANILRKEGMQAKELRHGGEVLARRRLLRQAFEWIAENEIQITDYLKYD